MNTLPLNAGISLKPQHYNHILSDSILPDLLDHIGWFEVHPENYMCDGGKQHFYLSQIREYFPVSMHGVGMSLGSAEALSTEHLKQWKRLVDRYTPACISEHLAWTQIGGVYSNDLLPVHYTHEALNAFCHNIEHMQNILGRKILIENPSVYIDLKRGDYNEGQFIAQAITQTGCGLLLDLNNIKVSSHNLNISQAQLLKDYPLKYVEEIHLAGHTQTQLSDRSTLLLDNHGSHVCDDVWQLFKQIIKTNGAPIATLIEWDTDIPPLETLIAEAQKANCILQSVDSADHSSEAPEQVSSL